MGKCCQFNAKQDGGTIFCSAIIVVASSSNSKISKNDKGGSTARGRESEIAATGCIIPNRAENPEAGSEHRTGRKESRIGHSKCSCNSPKTSADY